jgi:hypothetical protein
MSHHMTHTFLGYSLLPHVAALVEVHSMPQPSLQWVVRRRQLSIWVGPTCSYKTVGTTVAQSLEYIYTTNRRQL